MNQVSNPKNKPLGRGLASLLGPEILDEDKKNLVSYIDIDSIIISKYQPRTVFEDASLNDLATSIREVGILQPLIVRKHDDDSYELIAGERRLRAAMISGLDQVPALIKEFDDKKAFEATLIENIQRSDLTPIEEAVGYQQFLEEFNYSQEELSQFVGKSRSYIANSIRLLNLPDKVKGYVHKGLISAGHARTLLTVSDSESLADEIISRKLNVRQAEAMAKKKNNRNNPQGSQVEDQDIIVLEGELSSVLKSNVKISVNGHKGKIEIYFSSLEELDDLVGRLSSLKENARAA